MTVALDARRFADSPAAYFGHSWHAMHHLPAGDLQALQLAALQLRFDQLRDAIPVVSAMAAEQGVEAIEELEDVVPLLLQHSVYKSGALNQLGCVNARVVYCASGVDAAGVERANRLGQAVYDEMLALPPHLSTKAKVFDPELRASVEALRASPDWYRVIGGAEGEGAVIVSQLDEPVAFHRSLSGRVANIVPIADPLDALSGMNASSQTVGVYPEALKRTLRDLAPLHGAQRLVSLGYAADPSVALPQDAIEPVRRMVRWIVDETCDPHETPPLWT